MLAAGLAPNTPRAYLEGMKVRHRFFDVARVLLRLSLVLVLLVEFSFPHSGMAHPADNPTMAMSHAMPMPSQMDHKDGRVAGMDGSLCAMLGVGTDRAEGMVLANRVMVFRTARWIGTAGLLWRAPTPDPALRPPDTFLNA